MRHQTGLRNKFRSGRSTYSIKRKSDRADRYGAWSAGIQVRTERVNGHVLSYNAHTQEWR